MPGPPPNPNRQRRNKAVTAATLPSEAAAARQRVPLLPNRGPGKAWHKRTRAWWEASWKSPIAARWKKHHFEWMYELAELIDIRNKLPADELSKRLQVDAEIRMQRRDLGLTPADQLRMQWTDTVEPESKAPAETVSMEQEPDPRNLLRMVQ